MEREKVCQYCHKKFTAKRIDARYCSTPCRQMGYRRKEFPEIYGKVVPIYFELDGDNYEQLLRGASRANIHPNEYAKHLLFNSHEEGQYIHLFFKEYEWHRWIEPALNYFNVDSAEDMVMKWVKDRIFAEMEAGNI